VGVDVNFGIVADVTADPASFIAGRVLGGDPHAAADRVAAAVAGERGAVLSTLKHFPGHGAAPGDSHASVPTAPLTIDEWRAGPAIPFAAGIDAGAELVMTGHLAYPAVDAAPASLSPEWHRILREELGFDGVVVTDDMLMLQHNGLPEYADAGENAVRAVEAGSDLLLYVLPADPSEFGISVEGLVGSLVAAVGSGRVSAQRLDDAVERVLTLRRGLVSPSDVGSGE
jgi:beta-N-acetylhexosaminidase